jgi:hypothetical protein
VSTPPEYGSAQWGLDVPHGYQPVYLVPRPPRPGVVTVAVILTCVGAAIAALGVALAWAHGDLSAPTTAGGPDAFPVPPGLFLILAAVAEFALPAAGAVVAAIFTSHGANAARIVLASLMGLFALVGLCQQAGTLSTLGLDDVQALAMAGVGLVNVALAVTIGVLLLVPAANRYFVAGPGRRFAPPGTPVPSTYDPP